MNHLVLLSGGKDSTAMALRLREVEPRDYTYLCTPTGAELPDMEAHWSKLEGMLGQEIVRVGERTLMGLCVEQKAIPNYRMRFCTRLLKIAPFKAYLVNSMPAVGYVGLRADEAQREGVTYTEPEIKDGLTQRYPLSEWGWGISHVRGYLAELGVTIPPRTDCDVCFFQRLGEWWRLWREHPDRYERGVLLEATLGHTFRSDQRDTHPAALADLRQEFEEGYVPRGADQLHLDIETGTRCAICSM